MKPGNSSKLFKGAASSSYGTSDEDLGVRVVQPAEAEKPAASDRPAGGSAPSVIGKDIVITGNIEATVDLNIDGRVNGDVRCATLVLGEGSLVKGNIFAERVKVGGVVEGKIDSRDVAIEAGAQVRGEVSYVRIRVATGAALEGNLTRKS